MDLLRAKLPGLVARMRQAEKEREAALEEVRRLRQCLASDRFTIIRIAKERDEALAKLKEK